MALRWKLYRANVPEVDISDRVRADTISVRANAEEGSVPLSTIVVDDPDGSIDIPGLFYTIDGYETEAPALDQRLYRGFVADRTVSRGESDKSYRTTDARQWAVQAADPNSLLSRRVLLGTDANRPAETDVARIQYLMLSPEMTTVGITDSTYIDTVGPIQMDACDYRGQTVVSVIDDCAQASGKNYWVMPREDLGAAVYSLWYDFPESTDYASAITISNVASDVDGVACFAAAFDTALTRDPSRVYSGVYMPFTGGTVYVQNLATASNFQTRDTTSSSYNVKTAAKATARANRYLADINTEEDRITTGILVPNAQVNALKEGHLVAARFSHLPGYEVARNCRVLNRTVTQVSEEYYRIEVELTPAGQTNCNPFYPNTPDGFYPALGSLTSAANGYIIYWRSSALAPTVPTPYWVGEFWYYDFYPGWDSFYAGGADTVRCFGIGPGTITVHTHEDPAYPNTPCQCHLYSSVNPSIALETQTGQSGDDFTFTVPAVPGDCLFWVDFGEFDSGVTRLGFEGFTWVGG